MIYVVYSAWFCSVTKVVRNIKCMLDGQKTYLLNHAKLVFAKRCENHICETLQIKQT